MESNTKASVLRRSVCALLAAVLVMTGLVMYHSDGTVYAATKTDANEFKNNSNVKKYQQSIADLEKKQANLKGEIASLKGDISDWQSKKAYYDELAEICDEKIAASENLKTELEVRMEIVRNDIEDKTTASEELYEQIKERMVISYESGGSQATFLELLFGANDLVDFLIGLDRATSLLEYDVNLMSEYDELKAELEEEAALLEADTESLDALIQSLETEKADAEKMSRESENLITKAMSSLEASNKVMAELEAAEAETAKKLDNYIDELIKKRGETQSVTEGAYMWPLETRYTNITSGFGMRNDPFGSGVKSNHGGTDIYAPEGSKIYASNNGTVVKAEKDVSYGNYIMIDHGGGIYTIYAHCSKLLVKEGTYVTKGTLIAEVGHTGHATGNHLHFEVREGKTRVNALRYVKKP